MLKSTFKPKNNQINYLYLKFRPFDSKNPYLAPITVNKNIFKGTERKCLHIELDITGSRLR